MFEHLKDNVKFQHFIQSCGVSVFSSFSKQTQMKLFINMIEQIDNEQNAANKMVFMVAQQHETTSTMTKNRTLYIDHH